jgi:hypothetical protein
MRRLTVSRTQEDVREEFFHQYRQAQERLAQAKKRRKYAEESKGRVVALEMKAAEQRGVKSVGAQEREAKAGAAYKVWLDELADAVLEEARAWIEVNILEKQWDAWREKAWNKRAEIKLGG